MPIAAIIRLSNCPAAPTNGSPWRSSSAPAASPIKQSSGSSGPTPNTVCVRIEANSGHRFALRNLLRPARATPDAESRSWLHRVLAVLLTVRNKRFAERRASGRGNAAGSPGRLPREIHGLRPFRSAAGTPNSHRHAARTRFQPPVGFQDASKILPPQKGPDMAGSVIIL